MGILPFLSASLYHPEIRAVLFPRETVPSMTEPLQLFWANSRERDRRSLASHEHFAPSNVWLLAVRFKRALIASRTAVDHTRAKGVEGIATGVTEDAERRGRGYRSISATTVDIVSRIGEDRVVSGTAVNRCPVFDMEVVVDHFSRNWRGLRDVMFEGRTCID